MTIRQIHQELTAYIPEYDKMKKWRPPKWLGSDELVQSKQYASIVVDLTSERSTSELSKSSILIAQSLPMKTGHRYTNAINVACSLMPPTAAPLHAASYVDQKNTPWMNTQQMPPPDASTAKVTM